MTTTIEQAARVIYRTMNDGIEDGSYSGPSSATIAQALADAGLLATGWHPIATAPKDGTTVLVRHKDCVGEVYDVAIFAGVQPDGEQRWIMGDIRLESRQLTHWMTLPGPPDA